MIWNTFLPERENSFTKRVCFIQSQNGRKKKEFPKGAFFCLRLQSTSTQNKDSIMESLYDCL